MPKLAAKHQNQTSAMYGDFTGGLNTATAEEFIEDNQLSECVNMETDQISHKLYTVLGTVDIADLPFEGNLVKAFYDNINKSFLMFASNGDIYSADNDFSEIKKIGELTGTDYNYITAVCWEDGVLISNGGKLQYAKSTASETKKLVKEDGVWKYIDGETTYTVETIESSPDVCYGVFVRSGRVIVHDGDDNILYSGVGDETNWEQDANDPSSALFAEIGYKAGGKITSICPNSADILIMKDNGLCYKLENEYPDWNISEVSRELYCANVDSSCSLGNGTAMVLGNGILQNVTVTQDYGDMKPQQMGQQVARQIATLPKTTKLRYIASLNQVWFITGTQYVLVYDVGTGGFFQRWYNANVKDVISVDQQTILVRDNKLSVIDFNNGYCQDNGEPMIYQARFKTDMSLNNILVKRECVSVTPMVKFYDTANVLFSVGKVDLKFPLKEKADDLVQTIGVTQVAKELDGTPLDERYIHNKAILLKARKAFRTDRVRLFLSGKGFPFILNFITYDKVEV